MFPAENVPMAVSTKLMTADELLMLPDDGKRYELIEGVLNEMSHWQEGVHGLTAMEGGCSSFTNFVHQRGAGRGFRCLKQDSFFPLTLIRSAPPMLPSLPPIGCRRVTSPTVICGWHLISLSKLFPLRTRPLNCKARYALGSMPGAGWCGSSTPLRGQSPFTGPGKTCGCWAKGTPWTAPRSSTDSAPRYASCFVNPYSDLQQGALTPWSKAPR